MSQFEAVRQWVGEARQIAVLTGAGMSAESGVPTFRDALTGLWAQFNPADLATEAAFRDHPTRVWDWYAERRAALIGRSSPTPGTMRWPRSGGATQTASH